MSKFLNDLLAPIYLQAARQTTFINGIDVVRQLEECRPWSFHLDHEIHYRRRERSLYYDTVAYPGFFNHWANPQQTRFKAWASMGRVICHWANIFHKEVTNYPSFS
jgi:hypothetical protein